MIIIDYQKKNHNKIVQACTKALKDGKAVAYPTDTSYGLAVDATNNKAIQKLYKIKGRDFNKPVHVVVPSLAYAKKIVKWNSTSSKLAKKFWPGALTQVLGVRYQVLGKTNTDLLTAKSGFLGIRMPKNRIALDLSSRLNRPITATSANRSGQSDCYSADDIVEQFKGQKYKPDIIINAGKLAKRKPSTLVKISDGRIEILREGPVSEKNIKKVLGVSF